MTNDNQSKKNDGWSKLMFGVLIFFGITTLILGILQINKSINNPLSLAEVANQAVSDNNVTVSNQSIDALKATDTDGDGLNDYEEMYIYHTSIYLTDTDLDGYSDKEEVDAGYDPNCPKGVDCRKSTAGSKNPSPTTITTVVPAGSETTMSINPQAGASPLSADAKAQLKNLTVDQIKALLISSGKMTQADLDKIDDATLMKSFTEALNQ